MSDLDAWDKLSESQQGEWLRHLTNNPAYAYLLDIIARKAKEADREVYRVILRPGETQEELRIAREAQVQTKLALDGVGKCVSDAINQRLRKVRNAKERRQSGHG